MSFFKLLVCSFVAVTFISTPALAGGMKCIKKEAGFNTLVVGKTLSVEDATFVVLPNGKVKGKSKVKN